MKLKYDEDVVTGGGTSRVFWGEGEKENNEAS